MGCGAGTTEGALMPRSRGRKKKKMVAIKLPPEAKSALEDQLVAFRKKFGREPGPNDPIFFDPTKDIPTFIEAGSSADDEMQKALFQRFLEAGAEARHIYAYKKTGRMGLEATLEYWPADARAEWEAAIAEFHELEAAAQGSPV